jgi:hypothetical protein
MSDQESLQHASQTQETDEKLPKFADELREAVIDLIAVHSLRNLQLSVLALSDLAGDGLLEPDWWLSNAILQRKFETLNEAELDRVARYLPTLLEVANRAIAQRQRSKSETTEG